MYLTEIQSDVARYLADLRLLACAGPEQGLVRDCLGELLPQWPEFARNISPDSPLLHEFCVTVKARNCTPDACFALLECCILFVREKALRHALACPGSPSPLSAVERSLLHHFERSGAWPEREGLLVTHWYWHELPRRYTT